MTKYRWYVASSYNVQFKFIFNFYRFSVVRILELEPNPYTNSSLAHIHKEPWSIHFTYGFVLNTLQQGVQYIILPTKRKWWYQCKICVPMLRTFVRFFFVLFLKMWGLPVYMNTFQFQMTKSVVFLHNIWLFVWAFVFADILYPFCGWLCSSSFPSNVSKNKMSCVLS